MYEFYKFFENLIMYGVNINICIFLMYVLKFKGKDS